ncbi:conserved Plasmodium protein, unknown function [Plasmodium ovale curtisi]|uniref:Uncharacterized protein n=1 Tax=Plasmodium ovale curtisi TaxID=864141 RepID=A0A1A8WVC2_PLAOA|nr:conserved Plasmodium protein, unknown function [Plasmodium ovale curtisi]SBS96920.1 conserved Plasmodium protein, unknown function [Plasmodium ovale curtisi]
MSRKNVEIAGDEKMDYEEWYYDNFDWHRKIVYNYNIEKSPQYALFLLWDSLPHASLLSRGRCVTMKRSINTYEADEEILSSRKSVDTDGQRRVKRISPILHTRLSRKLFVCIICSNKKCKFDGGRQNVGEYYDDKYNAE